ncbi:uncharacterized protein LOC117652964 [Thrips palmi]|uniref:Uncharacterized protein LOC117652964 n=1 Tax=Thrips palmi TaxID=161013 RepID=A0A6P9A9X0_THRPL|nr:uncharacterized protein LOC117652964 [Thrips palmi]
MRGTSAPPASGKQRPFEERAAAVSTSRRHSVSPTRAPVGWSMFLSVERARRALKEEVQNLAALASKASKSNEAEVALEEKREVKDPLPRRLTGGLNNDQVVNRLELQIDALRESNAQLLVRLWAKEEADLQTNSDLRLEIKSLLRRLNAVENLTRFQVEENYKLRSSMIHLSQNLEKSEMENKAAIQKWCDEVAKWKSEVEKQRKCYSDLMHKLLRSTRTAGQVQVIGHWSRHKEAELSQRKGASAREKQKSAPYPVESRRAARQERVLDVEHSRPPASFSARY